MSSTNISYWKHRFSFDHRSETTSSLVSTWTCARLGIRDTEHVDIQFFFIPCTHSITHFNQLFPVKSLWVVAWCGNLHFEFVNKICFENCTWFIYLIDRNCYILRIAETEKQAWFTGRTHREGRCRGSALYLQSSIVLLRCTHTVKLLWRHSGLSTETSLATRQNVLKQYWETCLSRQMYGCS